MNPYKSCQCRQCRLVGTATKREHKRRGHRALRRAEKAAIRTGSAAPPFVSTGYRA